MTGEKRAMLLLFLVLAAGLVAFGFYLNSDVNRNLTFPPSPEEKIEELEAALAAAEADADALGAQQAQHNEQVERLKAAEAAARAELEGLQATLAQTRAELEEKQAALGELSQELAARAHAVTEWEQRAEELTAQTQRQGERIDELEETLIKARNAVQQQQAVINSQKDLLAELESMADTTETNTAPSDSENAAADQPATEPGGLPLRY